MCQSANNDLDCYHTTAKKRKKSKESHGKDKSISTTQHATAASRSITNSSAATFPSLLLSPKSQKQSTLQPLVQDSVFVAKTFFTESECLAWVDYTEQQIGFEKVDSPQTRDYAHRKCGRIQRNLLGFGRKVVRSDETNDGQDLWQFIIVQTSSL